LHPCYTEPADAAVAAAGFAVEPGERLPAFADPTYPPVIHPDPEPLVPLAHRRIRVLSNYWHAGWAHAVPTTWLRAEAMERLGHAANALPDRLGLAVFDAWRPLSLQAELYDAAYAEPGLPEGYVAEPIPDPATPPPHLTGGTVDLTLTLDGTPLALGTGFDDFTDRAAAASLEAEPGPSRELRRLLYRTMRGAGFVVLHCEWWHFEFGTRRWAAITGNEPRYGPAQPPSLT
jgi:D-alanyl-D-alanine dipeptidase